MFFEINKNLCEVYHGLDPIKLLDYPAEDVIDLINHMLAYNRRNEHRSDNSKVIRKKAGDNWF